VPGEQRAPKADDVWEHDGVYYVVCPVTEEDPLATTGLIADSGFGYKIHDMEWLQAHGRLQKG